MIEAQWLKRRAAGVPGIAPLYDPHFVIPALTMIGLCALLLVDCGAHQTKFHEEKLRAGARSSAESKAQGARTAALMHNVAVRSTLILILLLVLPLQLSFAAGAEYCEFGKPHASHLGHHAHEDGGGVEEATDKTSGELAGGHCAFCHLGCAQGQASTFSYGHATSTSLFAPAEICIPRGIPVPVSETPPRGLLA